MREREILLRPIISEKSYALMDQGSYVFVVDPEASKLEIRQAVEKAFNVKVLRVNTMRRTGKKIRRRTGQIGKRPDTKRAIVTLGNNDRIEIFEEIRS